MSFISCEKSDDIENKGDDIEGKGNHESKHEYVDLGLSVKWATCNVGADKPEEYGDYFAWGEITPKTTYDWSTYKWCQGSQNTFTKYCISTSYGTVDNKTTLEAADDAATANWGAVWRMPTFAELDELRSKCSWTWTTQNGVNGFRFIGPNGNSIFLPAAGYLDGLGINKAGFDADYWSSSLYELRPDVAPGSTVARCLYLFSDRPSEYGTGHYRLYGLSVRPVTE